MDTTQPPRSTCPTWGQVKLAVKVLTAETRHEDNLPDEILNAAEKVIVDYLTADLPNIQIEHTKNANSSGSSKWFDLTHSGDFS